MSRTKGSFSLAGAIEPLISAPLDAREKVATKAELTVSGNFPYPYVGMETYVVSENKKYRLVGEDPTNIENWQEVKEGGGSGTDYADLSNKPSIENVTLSGNKSASDLGLAKITDLADFITKTVDDLVNYYKKTETYTKGEVDAIATAIKNSRFEVVATLPTSNIKTNVIYLVPSSDPKSGNVKDEYINLNGTSAGWECIGSTSVDLSGYVTDEELNTALADYVTSTDLTALLANKQDRLQYSILPTASAELEGKIFEYTGATGGGLTHGYFYECVSDGQTPATYSWVQTNVQPNSGSTGGGHTIEDSEGTDLTQRDTLQFGEGFKAEDDDTNEKTIISPDVMQSGDMDDVITPLPSVQPRYQKYSTDEQVVGEWIDGKPLYQKSVQFVVASTHTTVSNVPTGVVNGKMGIIISGYLHQSDGNYLPVNYYSSSNAFSYAGLTNDISNFRFQTVSSNIGATAIITIQYTKTTD